LVVTASWFAAGVDTEFDLPLASPAAHVPEPGELELGVRPLPSLMWGCTGFNSKATWFGVDENLSATLLWILSGAGVGRELGGAGGAPSLTSCRGLAWARMGYSDEKVANRDTKIWHLVIENGY
jgi:hypothetical protein